MMKLMITSLIACLLLMTTAVMGLNGTGICSSKDLMTENCSTVQYDCNRYWENSTEGKFLCNPVEGGYDYGGEGGYCERNDSCSTSQQNDKVPEFGVNTLIVFLAIAAVAFFVIKRK